MAKLRRANGAGSIYIKHGAYYGRWLTIEGGQTNRKLGPVRRPGTRDGLTRTQAEKQLRELMQTVQVTSDPERTMAFGGQALLARLEAKGSSRSHIETAESHLRVHLVPFFSDKPLDRITDTDVTRLLVRLDRLGRKPRQSATSRARSARCSSSRCAGAGSRPIPASSSTYRPSRRARRFVSSRRTS